MGSLIYVHSVATTSRECLGIRLRFEDNLPSNIHIDDPVSVGPVELRRPGSLTSCSTQFYSGDQKFYLAFSCLFGGWTTSQNSNWSKCSKSEIISSLIKSCHPKSLRILSQGRRQVQSSSFTKSNHWTNDSNAAYRYKRSINDMVYQMLCPMQMYSLHPRSEETPFGSKIWTRKYASP